MDNQNRAGGQPELWQDHPVQCPDRLQPVRGQLARRHRGEKGGPAEGTQGRGHPGPARHLFPVPLHPGGGGGPWLSGKREARRHLEHRGRHQHRAQPVPDHPAHRAGHPRGGGREHDRPGAEKRGQNRSEKAGRGPGLRRGGDERPEGRGRHGGRPALCAGRPRRQGKGGQRNCPMCSPAAWSTPSPTSRSPSPGRWTPATCGGTPSRCSSGTRRCWRT